MSTQKYLGPLINVSSSHVSSFQQRAFALQERVSDGQLEFMVHIASPEEVIDTCDIKISALESEAMETDFGEALELVPNYAACVEFLDAGIALGTKVSRLHVKVWLCNSHIGVWNVSASMMSGGCLIERLGSKSGCLGMC